MNQNSFICTKYSRLASAYTWKVLCQGRDGDREVLTRLSFISSCPKKFGSLLTVVPKNPQNPVFHNIIIEFSLQITRGVDFTLSSAANNLCRHICPCLSTSVHLNFLQHTSLKSLRNNTFNTATSAYRNCPHTSCVTGRDISIKRIHCKARRTSKRKFNHNKLLISRRVIYAFI